MKNENELRSIFSTVGLIAASVDRSAQAYLEWQSNILKRYNMRLDAKKRELAVREALVSLLPFTTPIRTRFVFVGTSSRWTAFFDNGFQGTDAAGTMPIMSERLGCESIRVSCVDKQLSQDVKTRTSGRYGAMILEVFGADGVNKRTIYAANDGGTWKFGQLGAPYDFEDQNAYTRRRIKDRFTAEMLIDYLRHLDAIPFEAGWYTKEVVTLQKLGALPASLVEHTSTV